MSSTPNPPPGLRILVVENDADTVKYLALFLEELKHGVTSARSMTEALKILAKEKFDVLIADMGLPDGSGLEIPSRAGARNPRFAIAMSGFGMNADRVKSKDAGFRHHLLKPFKAEDLAGMLAEAAAERRPMTNDE